MRTEEHYLKKELYSLIKEDASIFEFFQEGSLDGIWYWDLEKQENRWMSPRFWEIFGFDPAKMKHLVSEWQDIIFAEDLQVAIDNFTKHCENPNHPYDQIVRYRHKDGSTIWVRCRGIAIRDKTGKPIRMIGAHTDLTAQKKAEQVLRRGEERFRNVYETAPLAFVIWDIDTRVTEWNKKAEEIFGWSKDEVIGQDFFDFLIPEKDRPKVGCTVDRLKKGEIQTHVINDNLTKTGKIITCEWSNSTLKDDDGNIVGAISLGLDITDRIRAESAQSESERLSGVLEMAGAVCHELNQPLQAIVGYTELLLMGINSNHPGQEKIKNIKKQVERLGGITNKLAKITKYETTDYLGAKIIDIDKSVKPSG